jgi:pilus assembly protein CpaE
MGGPTARQPQGNERKFGLTTISERRLPFMVYIHHRENGWPLRSRVKMLNSFVIPPIHRKAKRSLARTDLRLDDRSAGSSRLRRRHASNLRFVSDGPTWFRGATRMYALPVVLLGIGEDVLPGLKSELIEALAGVESEFQSSFALIDCLRHYKTQPRLLILQIGTDCQADTVERLADCLRGWPILALLPDDQGEDFFAINRAGAVQVLALPLDPSDFHRALGVIGAQFDKGALDKQVIGITSVAGGSGATTIAVNLAYEIAERLNRSAILAELTLQMGAVTSMLNLKPRVTLPHLLREIHRVDDFLLEKALVPVTERFKVLAAAHDHKAIPSVEPEHVVKIVECLRKLATVTVLDMPGTFDELEFQVLKTCDHVVVVATQSLPSLRSLKSFCESLPEERLVHSLWVVLNRYNSGMKGFTCEDIKDAVGVARVFPVVNDFHAVNLSVNKGRPLRHVAPGTPILHDLNSLIHQLMGLDHDFSRTNGRGLFGRMLHALKR